MSRTQANGGEARRQLGIGSFPPSDRLPRLAGQGEGQVLCRNRLVVGISPNQGWRPAASAPWLGRQGAGARRPQAGRGLDADGIGQAEVGKPGAEGGIYSLGAESQDAAVFETIADRAFGEDGIIVGEKSQAIRALPPKLAIAAAEKQLRITRNELRPLAKQLAQMPPEDAAERLVKVARLRKDSVDAIGQALRQFVANGMCKVVLCISAPVEKMAYENPHGELTLQSEGKGWRIIMAPPSRMLARGLPPEMLMPGTVVQVEGYPNKAHADEMRAERIIVSGKRIELR